MISAWRCSSLLHYSDQQNSDRIFKKWQVRHVTQNRDFIYWLYTCDFLQTSWSPVCIFCRSVSEGCEKEGLSIMFMSLSKIFSVDLGQSLGVLESLQRLADKMLDHQWMCFSLEVLSSCVRSKNTNLVESIWCSMLSLVEVTIPRYENSVPLETKAIRQEKPWATSCELWSIEGIELILETGRSLFSRWGSLTSMELTHMCIQSQKNRCLSASGK